MDDVARRPHGIAPWMTLPDARTALQRWRNGVAMTGNGA
jgi:hypothetical protein